MKNSYATAAIFISLCHVFILCGNVYAQSAIELLSESQYTDPNDYFKIVPPASWQIQQYPEDPRGKVAFLGPDDGPEIRVLAKGLDYNTFEEMVDELKGIEKQIDTNTNIERIMFINAPAIKRTFTFKGLKMLFVDFMIGNTQHNIMYSAPPNRFEEYLSLAWESINTYEPSLRGVSPEDVTKHAIARSIRLSDLFLKQGNYDLSLKYVHEGLEVEPNNPDLLETKKEIEQFSVHEANETLDDKSEEKSDSGDQDDNDNATSPLLFMALSIGGALVFIFQTSIAEGTSWPGFAKLTTPIIGLAMMFYGIVEGLFNNDHMFLGIIAIVLTLIVLASPFIIPIIKEKKGWK